MQVLFKRRVDNIAEQISLLMPTLAVQLDQKTKREALGYLKYKLQEAIAEGNAVVDGEEEV